MRTVPGGNMSIDTDIAPPVIVPVDEDDKRHSRAPLVGALPPGFVLAETAAGSLRSYLDQNGLSHFRTFYCADLDLDGIDKMLKKLGESDARWEAVPAQCAHGATPAVLTHGTNAARFWPSGFLHLSAHEAVIARWYWTDEYSTLRTLWLAATPTTQAYVRLRDDVRKLRRSISTGVWQIIRDGWSPPETLPRDKNVGDTLTLDPALAHRLDGDIVRFFTDEVAAMYADLRVPQRRGVLLHGPPGNGKTSFIKLVAARLPEVPMIVLRPAARFNEDALQKVLGQWVRQAPAVMIIEDLDHLLKQLNVSAFLNALDGIDAGANKSNGALLLLATTNHPEQLDPAINNRPGRFDVVVEVPNPNTSIREAFFRAKLTGPDAETLASVLGDLVRETDGLSFAHLQEILRASGLAAIHAGRSRRTGDDLLHSAAEARAANDQANRGFPVKPDAPFGLARRSK
jgi:hypothetical protein